MVIISSKSTAGLVAAAMSLSGCAAVYRTRPQDMSAPEHRQAAERAETKKRVDIAAAHRDAARKLEEAERASCSDLPKEQIASALAGLFVGTVDETTSSGGEQPVIDGARLLVALQGRSLETVGRIIECRAARAALTDDPADPFAVAGAAVRVSPADAGWAKVEIRALGEEGSGEEILRRVRSSAQRL
jgi:hypothetical protein